MEICPFCGIRYSQGVRGGVATFICPPYDVINPEQQKFYYRVGEYNAIRLEFPLEQVEQSGVASSDKYHRAAETFQEWLEEGILKFDDQPSFYLHDHYFTYLGKRYMRRGLFVRLKLVPWGEGIYPHEETSPKDKSDRFQMMKACHANFSPLFCLYRDEEKSSAAIFSEVVQGEPVLKQVASPQEGDGGEERHDLWRITDRALQEKLIQFFSGRSLYLADGHHRYETALTYQQERQSSSPGSSGEASDYVLVSLVEFSDPGLVIFPIHRMVRGISPSLMENSQLLSRLEKFFVLDFVPLSGDVLEFLLSDESINDLIPEDCLFAVLGLKPGHLGLLRKRKTVVFEEIMPVDRSPVYQNFGISILNHVVLETALGLSRGKEHVSYTVSSAGAYQRVEQGEYQLAFLLRASRPDEIEAVVDAGDRMPRKSTYFYPKVPAGLVINSLG
ncbi:MAG: DUF1015 domain-containing protein [Dehalococcoidia bacterium]|nr:DUF1015 domain-containing protein [Dehalococcoidia bacterium]